MGLRTYVQNELHLESMISIIINCSPENVSAIRGHRQYMSHLDRQDIQLEICDTSVKTGPVTQPTDPAEACPSRLSTESSHAGRAQKQFVLRVRDPTVPS